MAVARDARQFPRYPVDLKVAVSLKERQLAARTRDISRSGLCLVAPQPIPLQTRIEIRMVLTFAAGGHSEPLLLPGRVVWCTALFGSYQIGVMFSNLDRERARQLQILVAILEGAPSDPSDDEDTDRHHVDPDDPFRP
jgi:c-di-GMP-binding flagellar brake protein YcgR